MRLLCTLALLCSVAVCPAALEWTAGIGFRSAAVAPPPGRDGFSRIAAAQSGITHSNYLSEDRGITNQLYYNGSGVAAGDVDGDGLPDLYFCSLNGENRLFLNLGDFKFKDTTTAEVACPGQASTGAALADVDGDGDLDLLVTSIGRGVRLFINDGRGKFTEATAQAGLRSEHASMTMALADIDGDGDIDLYVANNRPDTFQDRVNMRFRLRNTPAGPQIIAVNDQPASSPELTNRYFLDARGAVQENAEADVLYLNDGHGHFSAQSWTDGRFLDSNGRRLTAAPLDWGLSAMFHDVNRDGAPDLYVCNDGDSPDHLWINDGRGSFREAGVENLRETSFSTMGIDFADINRDGFVDFFLADMLGFEHTSRQMLLAGRTMPSHPPGRVAVPRNTLSSTAVMAHGRRSPSRRKWMPAIGPGARRFWMWTLMVTKICLSQPVSKKVFATLTTAR